MRVLTIAVLAALMAACGGAEDGGGSGEILLGNYTDLSGPVAIWGVGVTNGARMRFDEVNAAGGVHGRQIRFIVEDTSYQVPQAVSKANKLIHGDGIFAMLMGVGTPTNNAVMPMQFEAGVPNLFPVTGARSMVEPPHRLMFSQHGIYYDEVRAGVKYFVEERGRENVCVIHVDNDYGVEILEGARDQAKAMGKEIVAVSAHKPTETEFTAAILRLKNANCDLVMMGTVHRDTILVLDAARKIGWDDADWVGNNAAYAQVIAEQESGQGYYCFVHMAKIYADDEMSPAVRKWWDGYVDEYGAEPGLAAMEGYRGADLAVLALERAGPDPDTEALIAAIEGITDYTDIFGYRVSFGPSKRSGVSESVLQQVQGGRFVTVASGLSY